MNKKIIIILIGLLIIGTVLSSCGPSVVETPSATELASTLDAPTVVPSKTLAPQTESDAVETARFSIEAHEEYQDAVSVLYETYFPGESPDFVESEGDLVVKMADIPEGSHPLIRATFLPDAVMIPQTNANHIQDFVNFAISLEGQDVLITNDYLPAKLILTDQAGNIVELSEPVTKVISTYGPATAFIYSVGAAERLVSASYLGARDPLGMSVMEKMDPRFPEIMGDDKFSQQDFNVEQAAVLNPDLIVTSTRTAWLDTVETLDWSVFLFDAETPERLKEAMRLAGQIFGPHSAAQSEVWVAYYEGVVNTISEQTASLDEDERPRVLFLGTEPTRVASGDMYQTDIIEAAGGVSVSAELGGYWNDVNLEQIAIWDPDVIIVPPYGGASVIAITESREWQILDAVQNGRVYQMPKLVAPWDTPAPDSVLGILWLAQRLHPNLIEMDCQTEATYFYDTFFNYSITQEELETVCKFE